MPGSACVVCMWGTHVGERMCGVHVGQALDTPKKGPSPCKIASSMAHALHGGRHMALPG